MYGASCNKQKFINQITLPVYLKQTVKDIWAWPLGREGGLTRRLTADVRD